MTSDRCWNAVVTIHVGLGLVLNGSVSVYMNINTCRIQSRPEVIVSRWFLMRVYCFPGPGGTYCSNRNVE